VSMPEPFAGFTGKGVRVAVIDSGVNSAHPHIGGVAGGVTITQEFEEKDYTDKIGHGTAVMAAIKEKAPDAEYFAVRFFYSSLRTTVDVLVRVIEWSLANHRRNQPESRHNQSSAPGTVHSCHRASC
jgi:hypothetical protein